MGDVIYSATDLSNINISTAQSCLIKANTTINQEEKIKYLIVASKLIDGALLQHGIDIEKVRTKKEK